MIPVRTRVFIRKAHLKNYQIRYVEQRLCEDDVVFILSYYFDTLPDIIVKVRYFELTKTSTEGAKAVDDDYYLTSTVYDALKQVVGDIADEIRENSKEERENARKTGANKKFFVSGPL